MAVLVQYANGVPGVKFPLDKQVISIGRSIENDICISDSFVSKFHAVVEIIATPDEPDQISYVLHDLNSTNSTFVNTSRITKHELDENDRVQIGQNDFRFVRTDDVGIDFVKTDTLSQSMMEFISPDLIEDAGIDTSVAASMDTGAKTERLPVEDNNNNDHAVITSKTDEKSQHRFSRRLNLF